MFVLQSSLSVQHLDKYVAFRTQKVLFPAHTVMNLLQDLVLREPRLAAKVTANHQPVVRTGMPPQHAFCHYQTVAVQISNC